jgi:hypothetical protein
MATVQHSRILIKRATTTGVVPTLPASDDHTDGTWLVTDIYPGELFLNLVDERIWTRFDSGIVELLDTSSISDTVFGAGWNGDTTHSASKNAIYDAFQLYLPLTGGALSGLLTGTKFLANTTVDTGTPDAAYKVSRLLNGNSASGHGFRDDTDFRDAGFAYCSYDSASYVNAGGATNFDHIISFQSRHGMSSLGTLSEMIDFGGYGNVNSGTVTTYHGYVSQPTFAAGSNVVTRFGVRIREATSTGTNSNTYGIYIDTLTKASGDRYAIYVEGNNPSFFGGTLVLNNQTASTVPYLDASKNLVSSSVTPTELGYVSGVTSAIQTQLNTKHGYTMMSTSAGFNPADSTIYYFGSVVTTVTSTADETSLVIPKTGTVKRIDIITTNQGTLGSNETSTIVFRLNNTTDTTINNAVVTNALRSAFTSGVLSIAVTAGDRFEIKWTAPSYATNPTVVRFTFVVYIE